MFFSWVNPQTILCFRKVTLTSLYSMEGVREPREGKNVSYQVVAILKQ